MEEMEFPDTGVDVEPTRPAALKARIDEGEPVAVLDTRAESEFEAWHLDGPTVDVENVPHEAFRDGVDADLLDRVPAPEDGPVHVVCAKGISSEFVAERLVENGVEATHVEDGMRGWARLYEYQELDADTDALVAQYRRPSSGCLSYLVVDGDEAAVVDPLRTFAGEYRADARALGAELVYAVDTHVHADHLSGVRALDGEGVTGVVPAPAAERGVTYADDVETVADGDRLQVGDAEIEAIHTPGHTSGMTAYLIDGAVLATGDGLFVESVARPDLEAGADGARDAARQLYDSLQERVLALDGDTVVAPAHFSDAAEPADDGTYTARLGTLVEEMDALTIDRERFVGTVVEDMPPRPANYEEIIETNLGQRDVDDREAFELELGPNNCAASRDAMTGDR